MFNNNHSQTTNQIRQILQQMEQSETRNAQMLQQVQQAEQNATQQIRQIQQLVNQLENTGVSTQVGTSFASQGTLGSYGNYGYTNPSYSGGYGSGTNFNVGIRPNFTGTGGNQL